MSNKKSFSILAGLFFLILFFKIISSTPPKTEDPIVLKAISPNKALARAKEVAGILNTDKATIDNVNQLKNLISKIPEASKQYVEAQALLKENQTIIAKIIAKDEKEKNKKAAAQAKMDAVLEEDKRIKFASTAEYAFLDNRMNVTVTTLGKNNKQLKLKYSLMSKVFIHQVLKSDFVQNVKKIGFTKIIFTDGYNDTYTLDLKDL